MTVGPDMSGMAGISEEDEIAEGLMLEPPDPLDLLIAHTEGNVLDKSRPLDFVRAKFADLKKENRRLKDRVADLEQTLTIVQTAQEWTVGRGMTQEQQEKMKEIKLMLEQAKRAREEVKQFSTASKEALYEKLRNCKAALRRERQDKMEMKDRLLHAFDHARAIKDKHRQLAHQRLTEQERWQDLVRDMKDRHRHELLRLQGMGAVHESDRHEQLSQFGEHVMDGLNALQQHLQEVRTDTVDAVIVEGEESNLLSESAAFGTSGEAGGDTSGNAGGELGGGTGALAAGDEDF